MAAITIPQAFVWRRLHSLMGLWLTLFLIEHLLVNSQAALLLGENGKGFVEMVNSIHNLPYLEVVEIVLLGVPILIHALWGIKYLFTAKPNSYQSDGSKPSLPEYGRNRAYTWQRITSWILVFGIIGHVAKFRFLDYPSSITQGTTSSYFIKVSFDKGIYTVADRVGVTLYDAAAVAKERAELKGRVSEMALVDAAKALLQEEPTTYSAQTGLILTSAQKFQQRVAWVEMLERFHVKDNELVVVAKTFGDASLFGVRDTFKSPLYVALYTLFVLAACFHGFNGLWTFLITWGMVLKMSAQRRMVGVCIGLMVLIAALGLASVWGTYWLNLRV